MSPNNFAQDGIQKFPSVLQDIVPFKAAAPKVHNLLLTSSNETQIKLLSFTVTSHYV